MTKKHDFLRDAQSPQKHPGKHQVGSLAYLQANAEQQHQRSDPQ